MDCVYILSSVNSTHHIHTFYTSKISNIIHSKIFIKYSNVCLTITSSLFENLKSSKDWDYKSEFVATIQSYLVYFVSCDYIGVEITILRCSQIL